MQTKRLLVHLVIYLILIISLCFFFFPFVLLLFDSFKSNAQILKSPFSLPTSIHFENFKIAIKEMHFFSSFFNTVFITAFGVAFVALFSSMAAHYFVRNKTKINQILFFMMVASMIIPFQAIMIPLVSIYGQKLHWIIHEPRLTLIFMYIGFGSSLAVFIYHGFIKSIPLELEEASVIDGCSRRQTFFKIVSPVMMPITVTIGILNILWIWNDYLLPLLILRNAGNDKLTLPLAVQVFNGTYSADYEKFLPAIMLCVLPVLIIYMFAQKFIIKGVMQGSIK